MKVYDEDGNYLGDFIENTKEKVEDAFESSWIWGVFFLLIIAPAWTIFGIIVYLVFKLVKTLVVFIFKLLWWLLRLPFCLIFQHNFPEF